MLNEQYEEAVAASIHKFDFHTDSRGSLFVQDLANFPVNFVRLFILEGIKKVLLEESIPTRSVGYLFSHQDQVSI